MFSFFKIKNISPNRGFTLLEIVIATAVFVLISTAAYQAYASLFQLISMNQYKVNALNLANEQFEIIRNLPYSDVGVQGSIPNGKIPHIQNISRGNINFIVTTTARNVDQTFDGTISGTPNDLSPADNKLIEVQIDCPTCKSFTPINLTTTVAPKGLETSSTNGALFVKVFDSSGIPVPNASVHVVNQIPNPDIVIDDVTDNNGMLQIVDAPPGNEAYEITVTKAGYSTDRTYTPGAVGNPSPSKPHATVLLQQLTQISFSIDQLSSISFKSVATDCTQIGNIDFSLVGSKTIGVGVPKYSANLTTDGSGTYTNSNAEWDFYTVTNRDLDYDIIGLNPLNPISVSPNSTQQVALIVASKNPKSLLITVKDNTTQLPITGATVKITKGGFSDTKITGRGSILQTSWAGGSGQVSFTDNTMYFSDDLNVRVDNPSGELKLRDDGFGSYNPNGVLESSTVDTGSPSNFYNFTWNPTDQPVNTGSDSVKFQFASNVTVGTSTTWNYLGPDGTSATYYTSPNSPLAAAHNGGRYARYKAFLHTDGSTSTPNISDVAFTVTSECTPPGQVVFSGLGAGTYQVDVSMTAYATKTLDVSVSGAWQESEFLMAP